MQKLTPEEKDRRVSERQRVLFGQRYVGSTLSKIRAPDWAQKSLVNFLDDPKNFLVYCGTPGIGKTYLCAAIIEWAFEKFGENWRYWTENNLLKQLRDSMEYLKGDYLDVLKYMIDGDLLILDDVGSSTKSSEWREEVLFAVIDYRYNCMKPTVFTSNFGEREFLNKYHSRIHSRLFSKDNTIIEILNGVDFRLHTLSDLENKIEGYKK